MDDFETVIGLEVHTQLNTESKIFCSCPRRFESEPNVNICPICCGYPGVLPVFNRRVLELAIRASLVLNCKINKEIYFERKSYFYPDLPKNYQISQYKLPLGEEGYLELPSGKRIGVTRVHIEEDAGKLIHKDDCSLIDFNRTGTPLLEIVSDPNIGSPQEAFEYLTHVKLILQYIGVSDCDMEKGSLRCDANISLRKKGETKLGTRVELKNMNSFKGVKQGLGYEEKRQAKALSEGARIIQETRLWDTQKVKTVIMRSKEEAHDYRYFPEPDLLNFNVPEEFVNNEKNLIGELPMDKRKRFLETYGISEKEVDVFINNKSLADFFESAVKCYTKPKEITNWLLGPFLEQVNNFGGGLSSVKISAQNFSKIVKYFTENKLNNLAAKKTLSIAIGTNEDVDSIIAKENLTQVSSEDELSKFIKEAVCDSPKPVKEYLDGKRQAIMFLVGHVMKKTKGKANPKVVRELLEKLIKEGGR